MIEQLKQQFSEKLKQSKLELNTCEMGHSGTQVFITAFAKPDDQIIIPVRFEVLNICFYERKIHFCFELTDEEISKLKL